MIELLETRIAPAAVLIFTDVDGDSVKITSSKGTNADLTTAALLAGGQLQKLDLSSATWGQKFKGASVTIAVAARGLTGDGIVNVGFIDAGGVDLGKVAVGGDLGRIVGGASAKGGVKSLTVGSLGEFGTTTGASTTFSSITGSGALTVTGDIEGAAISYTEKLTSLKIGGSLRGGAGSNNGAIFADSAGALKITGSILGSTGSGSGSIVIPGKAGAVSIGGEIVGGTSGNAGALFLGGTASFTINGGIKGGTASGTGAVILSGPSGKVFIGGSLEGGSNGNAGVFIAKAAKAVTVGGSLKGGTGNNSGAVFLDSAAAVLVSGNVEGGNAFNAGVLVVSGKSSKITIGGSLIGGGDSNNGAVIAGNTGAVVIGRNLEGSTGNNSGTLLLDKVSSVTIGGSIIGGPANASGSMFIQSASKITVFGSVTGGGINTAGMIGVAKTLGTLTIGGDVSSALFRINNGPGETTKTLVASAINISGSVSDTLITIGNFQNPDAQLGKLNVGGNWTASNLVVGVRNLGSDDAVGGVGNAADNVNFGDSHDTVIPGGSSRVVSSIASIIIGGRISGTVGGTDHFGFVAEKIGAFKIGGLALSLNKSGLDVLSIGLTDDVTIRETAVLM